MEKRAYVHGYSEREAERLGDQARTLTELLHHDTRYPAGSRVLEAGCGTGAQTVILARNSPDATITSLDISPDSIRRAEERVRAEGIANVTFRTGDLFSLPFAPGSFDHVFVCFVLEHLADPKGALAALRPFIKPGGTITVIEGDHGSAYFHPESAAADAAIRCLVDLQREAGGNALIGRELYPLLASAGYTGVNVSPRMKRKAAIARSLIHDPKFLVYDEATSGLDPMTSRFIAEYLKKLTTEGRTIVLSAHNLFQVEAICDRVMILRRGKVVMSGTMKELREQFGSITYTVWFSVPDPARIDKGEVPYREDEGYLACDAPDMPALNAVSAAISEAGGRVERIESRYPSLEEMLVAIGK